MNCIVIAVVLYYISTEQTARYYTNSSNYQRTV